MTVDDLLAEARSVLPHRLDRPAAQSPQAQSPQAQSPQAQSPQAQSPQAQGPDRVAALVIPFLAKYAHA